jgi:hypothetical protein
MTWFAGTAQPTFGPAFNSADITNLVNGSAVMSTLPDIPNTSDGDSLAAISWNLTIASATIAAGSVLSFYAYPLNQDGTTYGDGLLSPTDGQVAGIIPTLPVWSAEVPTATGVTTLVGTITRIILPAQNFRWALLNGSGQKITSGTIQFFTYN